VATEHSRNDGSKAQYYVVILDRLQDHFGGLERALESRIRGPLTDSVAVLLYDPNMTSADAIAYLQI